MRLIRTFFIALILCQSFGAGLARAAVNRSPAVPESVSEDIVDYIPKPMRRPNWAFSVLGSPVGQKSLSVQFDWQPALIQSFGVLGIGTALEYHPEGLSNNHRWLLGVHGRYQARLFSKQILVPTVAYYSFTTSDHSYKESGPSVGLWFYLNSIDSIGAAQSFVNLGVLRSYLTLEHRWIRYNVAQDSVWILGLRTEF